MNRHRTLPIIALTLSACAQPAADPPAQERPEFATEIPEAIITPNALETRLGTLSFFDGFPDDATVEKVYDNLDFQRGVQAFLAGMPAASMYAMGAAIRDFGPANETVLVFENRRSRHPRAGGDPPSRVGMFRCPWIPAVAGMTGEVPS